MSLATPRLFRATTRSRGELVCLLGWLGAQPRHVCKYIEVYHSLGADVVAFTPPMSFLFRPRTLDGHVEALSDALSAAGVNQRPLVVHAMSNNGAYFFGHLLSQRNRDGLWNSAYQATSAAVIDSAPSLITAEICARGYLSAMSGAAIGLRMRVEKSLGIEPVVGADALYEHPVWTPPLERFFARVLRDRERRALINTAHASLRSHAPQTRLFIYGPDDELIPDHMVEHFVDEQDAAVGFKAERLALPHSPHVGHLRAHPLRYRQALERTLARVQRAPMHTATGTSLRNTPARKRALGASASSVTTTEELGVYIHYPFCSKLCAYCNFTKYSASHPRAPVSHDRAEEWLRVYHRALSRAADVTGKVPVTSVYFGGGTPSLAAPSFLARVLDHVAAMWPISRDCEVTLECNPSSAETERMREWRAFGVSRVSIGAQSFVSRHLKQLGREHSATDAERAIRTALNTFPRVSFDLMFGLPSQTRAEWKAELEQASALAFAAGHVSLYQLTVKPGTPLWRQAKRNTLPISPENDLAGMYLDTIEALTAAGLSHYEVSNFATPGHESRHNLHVWSGGAYVGVGPGAHGRVRANDGTWYETLCFPQADAFLDGDDPYQRFRPLSSADRALERLAVGLRTTRGVPLDSEIVTCTDAAEINALEADGFLARSQGRLRATIQGMPLIDAILRKVIAVG